jgi:hypothetical protein
MRNIIVLFITFLVINSLNAKSDSLYYVLDTNYNNEIIDTNLINEDRSDILGISANSVDKKIKKREKNLVKPANWLSDAWDAFTDLWKPVWGLYTEDGYRQEGPYFLFDRKLEGPTYVQIQNIIKTFIN